MKALPSIAAIADRLDPAKQAALLRQLVVDESIDSDGEHLTFTLRLPPELAADAPIFRDHISPTEAELHALQLNTRRWLEQYFPSGSVGLGDVFGDYIEGKTHSPVIAVALKPGIATERFHALMNGQDSVLPDHRPLLEPENAPRAIMEQVCTPPVPTEDGIAVQFHVAATQVEHFARILQNTCHASPLYHVSPDPAELVKRFTAQFHGEAATHFLRDYARYNPAFHMVTPMSHVQQMLGTSEAARAEKLQKMVQSTMILGDKTVLHLTPSALIRRDEAWDMRRERLAGRVAELLGTTPHKGVSVLFARDGGCPVVELTGNAASLYKNQLRELEKAENHPARP